MRAESQVASPATSAGTLLHLLQERASRTPTQDAATHKKFGKWTHVDWETILGDVRHLSAALVARGIQPGDRVSVFADSSLPWCVADMAICAARAITVPIYASNTPDELKYVLQHSGAVMLFVDHDRSAGKQPGRFTRARSVLRDCPSVRQVITMEEEGTGGEVSMAKLIAEGTPLDQKDPRKFEERISALRVDDPCCFIYTSGTTGAPKGVMLTHGNLAYEAKGLTTLQVLRPDDAVMLFLPLAHSFAQDVKAAWVGLGYRMIFAQSTETLLADIGETSPTILPAVPRIFEKIYNAVVSGGMSKPGVAGKLFRWAMRLFEESVEARQQGRSYDSLSLTLAKKLVFSKVKATLDQKLGGKMRLFVSGGAPLSRKIAYFFDMLGFEVLEGYGLTETTGGATVNPPGRARIGTVGPPMPGCEVKIASDGEILIRGPNIMKGYYNQPEATREVLEPDGWFHSGDIGEIDPAGFVRITDRKKDIIVTAGGKNVAPQNLENSLKTFPLISQAMVHGDKRKYLSVLITVNEETARKLLQDSGITPPAAYADVAARPEIVAAVQKVLDTLNAHEPPYNQLKRFHIMDHDFTQESGDLTPTLKVKRKACTVRYQVILDGLYDGERVTD
ncbi:MAG TPA: long-chain fatty acid--CoA ligase [Myxococcaceae bacterium]|nr:long-chain fatty acid--CoA ligase [Myxococcaceae bacterium]